MELHNPPPNPPRDAVVSSRALRNHIKAWKNHLAADRTSCHEAEANQFRLFLHAGAYWLLWSMRRVMPKRSAWRVMQFDTLRLRLIKLAARVVELKTQIRSTCRRAPPIRRFSPCCSTACRVSSPESRGVCPGPAPFPSNLQRLPDPDRQTPAAGVLPLAWCRPPQPKRERPDIRIFVVH
jgi:hypothetical protein